MRSDSPRSTRLLHGLLGTRGLPHQSRHGGVRAHAQGQDTQASESVPVSETYGREMRSAILLCCAMVLGEASQAFAQSDLEEPSQQEAGAEPGFDGCVSSYGRPLLPPHLVPDKESYFVVGWAIERFGADFTGRFEDNNVLIGLAAMWRYKSFGPHLLLMSKPISDTITSYQDSRFLVGGGLRGIVDVPGFTELSYGVGVHLEARLEDHYWLAFATPLELGATIWRRGSWHMDLFLGARRAMAGQLIDHFLIDPNGIDNQNARDELHDARHENAWKGFVRFVFSRKID